MGDESNIEWGSGIAHCIAMDGSCMPMPAPTDAIIWKPTAFELDEDALRVYSKPEPRPRKRGPIARNGQLVENRQLASMQD